ncbi:MAG: glycosyltransferase family A protein, partial [Thermodesulfobacteriota bacterium]|nr:glycosyltransferase family A protein [Thermodesulfobacteriota bacterium]
MMNVSVVIPVYNGANFIAQTIQSALDQTLQGREVIVINDGSTDNSDKEILKFRDGIVYIKQENKGVSAARNIGIQRAKGEYIAFLDQDDVFLPNKLEKLASFLDQYPGYGMVYSSISRIDGDGNLLAAKKIPTHSGDIFPQLFMKCYIAPSMVMCRKQTLLDAGLF